MKKKVEKPVDTRLFSSNLERMAVSEEDIGDDTNYTKEYAMYWVPIVVFLVLYFVGHYVKALREIAAINAAK